MFPDIAPLAVEPRAWPEAAPRERSELLDYAPGTGIALRLPIPDFRHRYFASVHQQFDDAWVFTTDCPLVILEALQACRAKVAAGDALVERAKAEVTLQRPPSRSSYVRVHENLPVIPDPVLQKTFTPYLTYNDAKPLVKG